MLAKNDNASGYFMHHNEREYPLGNEGQDVEKDQTDLVGESSDNKRVKNMLYKHISQDGLLANESSSFLRNVWFSEQEFLAGIPVSDIKYNHSESQNNNNFYPFND